MNQSRWRRGIAEPGAVCVVAGPTWPETATRIHHSENRLVGVAVHYTEDGQIGGGDRFAGTDINGGPTDFIVRLGTSGRLVQRLLRIRIAENLYPALVIKRDALHDRVIRG